MDIGKRIDKIQERYDRQEVSRMLALEFEEVVEHLAALEAPTCKSLRARGPASPKAKATESAEERSRRLPDRIVHDMAQNRAYHRGHEIDVEAWKRGRLVTRR